MSLYDYNNATIAEIIILGGMGFCAFSVRHFRPFENVVINLFVFVDPGVLLPNCLVSNVRRRLQLVFWKKKKPKLYSESTKSVSY